MMSHHILPEIDAFLRDLKTECGLYYEIIDMRKILKLMNRNFPQVKQLLSTREIEVFSEYTFPKKRVQWLAGRLGVKHAFNAYMQDKNRPLDVSTIDVLNTAAGSPGIVQYPEVSVSISHCYPYCIAGVSQQTIGIDLESVFSPKPELLKYYYTANEAASVFATGTEHAKAELATLYWTRKEAVSKYLKLGMKIGFHRVDTVYEVVELPELTDKAINISSCINQHYCASVAFECPN